MDFDFVGEIFSKNLLLRRYMSERHGWHKCPTLPRAAWRRLHCACRRHGRHLYVDHEVGEDGRHLDFDVEDVVD